MRFLTAVAVVLLDLFAGTLVLAGRGNRQRYEDVNLKALTAGQPEPKYLKVGAGCGINSRDRCGYEQWSTLPKKASESQCSLALQRIAQQPRSCAQQYLARIARNVYLPFYQWFENNATTAVQFASDNAVAVELTDAFGNIFLHVDALGTVTTYADGTNLSTSFDTYRTLAINYPTFLREEYAGVAVLQQIVYNTDGRLLLVQISKSLTELPVVC